MKDDIRNREEQRIARDQRTRMQLAQQERRAEDERLAMQEANVWLKPLLFVSIVTTVLAIGAGLALVLG